MAKLPVTMTFSVNDLASKAIEMINQRLGQLDSAAGRFNKTLDTNKAKFSELNKAASAISASAMKVGAALTAGITAPVIAMGVSAITASADFERAMNDLGARTQASAGDMQQMQTEARRLGLSTVFGAGQAVEAMTALGKAGFETQDILKGTSAVLNLAAAEGMGMGESADFVADTLNQFGLAATEATSVVDKLAKASGISSISIQDLQYSMKYAAPLAKSFGMNIDNVAAAVATLGSAGIKGEQAGTAIRSLLNTITGDNNKIAMLQRAGVQGKQIFSDKAMTQLRTMPEILKAIAAANLTASQRFEIFGKEYGGTIGKLIQSTKLLDENIVKIGDSAGFAAEVAGAKTKGFWGEWEKLKNTVNEAYLQITGGEGGALNVLTGLIEKARALVQWFNDLSPGVKRFAVVVALLVAVVGPLLLLFSGILAMLPMVAAGWAFFTAVLLPFAPVVAVIIGVLLILSGALIQVYENWDDLVSDFDAGMDVIRSVTNDVLGLYNALQRFAGLPEVELFKLASDSGQTQGSRYAGASLFKNMSVLNGGGFSPAAAVGNGSKLWEPSVLAAQAGGDYKNEVKVQFAGFVPPGTTITEGANNSPEFSLNTGKIFTGAKSMAGGR